MLITNDRMSASEFAAASGWEIRPEGACRGDVCVPLPDSNTEFVDVQTLSERLGMPLVRHDDGLAALGPATVGGRALVTAEAPELGLPDFDGNEFRLSSLRGQKVVLVAWSPY